MTVFQWLQSFMYRYMYSMCFHIQHFQSRQLAINFFNLNENLIMQQFESHVNGKLKHLVLVLETSHENVRIQDLYRVFGDIYQVLTYAILLQILGDATFSNTSQKARSQIGR
jgi:hypothetical protein